MKDSKQNLRAERISKLNVIFREQVVFKDDIDNKQKKDDTLSVVPTTETVDGTKDDDTVIRKTILKPSVSVIDEDYDHQLFSQMESDSDSDKEEEDDGISYFRQQTLIEIPDFFEVLGEVPSLDDLSVSEDEFAIRCESIPSFKDVKESQDIGRFVDPLTGEYLESSDDIVQEAEAPVQEEVEEEEKSEDDDLLIPLDIEEVAGLEIKSSAGGIGLESFFTLEPTKQVVLQEDTDFETYEIAEAARQLRIETEQFVRVLVDQAVEVSEYIDPFIILRQNFDKTLLVEELKRKLHELDLDQRTRIFLNRKVVDYFRRKRSFRPISEDNPDTIADDIVKYKEATINLDQLLSKELEVKKITSKQIAELRHEVHEMQFETKRQIEHFEDLVRKSLVRETFVKLRLIVNSILEKVASTRNEISKVRDALIIKQHSLATLLKKSEKLENLGNGLRMKEFGHLQMEIQAMGKKIEERNRELNKLRTRFNSDLHVMSHMKEKQFLMRTTIRIQEQALRELHGEKTYCLSRLYNLKIERNHIHNEMRNLSFQGGLLDKPALMLDFDDTVERLEKVRTHVDQLKIKLNDIQNRIQILEADRTKY